jgi:hypothetical protein
MSHVELPLPLEDYFAHAELPGNGDARRFTLTLPYFDGDRLQRLQWWYHVTHAEQRVAGDQGLNALRRAATLRFRQHIHHWLGNHGFRLVGDGPIPKLLSRDAQAARA